MTVQDSTQLPQNSVSSFYWDKYRDTTMGRYLFHCEHTFIRRLLCTIPQPQRLLDVASGSGRMALPLHDAGINIVALELDPEALAAFKQRSNVVPLLRGDVLCLPFADGSFNAIVAI